ncbi:unnamed protein product [Phaeothamnion confervicola]
MGPADVGFDPLGLSAIDDLGLDVYWMKEAEIKHGRIAMLAAEFWFSGGCFFVVGALFCDQVGSFPGMPSGKDQLDVFWQVWAEKPAALGALLFAVVGLEIIYWAAVTQGGLAEGREPGEFGLDPLKVMTGDPAKKLDMQTKEIKNGR